MVKLKENWCHTQQRKPQPDEVDVFRNMFWFVAKKKNNEKYSKVYNCLVKFRYNFINKYFPLLEFQDRLLQQSKLTLMQGKLIMFDVYQIIQW